MRAYNSEFRLTEKINRLLDSNQRAYFLNFSANCWLAVRLELAGTLIITMTALFAVLSRDNRCGLYVCMYVLECNVCMRSTVVGNGAAANASRETFAGIAGLAISLAMNITQSLNWSVRMASDMESQMVSVERVQTYSVSMYCTCALITEIVLFLCSRWSKKRLISSLQTS